MTTITYQIKENPVYDQYGYIVGYDKIREISENIPDEKVDIFLSRLDDECIFNVNVTQTIAQERKASGEYLLDPEYWNEPY